MITATLGHPAHVPADRVIDFDLYDFPVEGLDYQRSLRKILQSRPADVLWTPRNGGTWIAIGFNEVFDALRRPERFALALLACRCDARGRLHHSEDDYPQAERLQALLTAALATFAAPHFVLIAAPGMVTSLAACWLILRRNDAASRQVEDGMKLRNPFDLAPAVRAAEKSPAAAPDAEAPVDDGMAPDDTALAAAVAVDEMQDSILGALAEATGTAPVPETPVAEAEIASAVEDLSASGAAPIQMASADPMLTDPNQTTMTMVEDMTVIAPPQGTLQAQAAALDGTLGVVKKKRNAPIYDDVQVASADGQPAAEQVVMSMSTSGDRHWGIRVGR